MGVRQGESRKEADRHATDLAFTTAVADPIMTTVVRLLRSLAQALDGAGLSGRTLPGDLTCTNRPVEAALAIIARTCDKGNRTCFKALSLNGIS